MKVRLKMLLVGILAMGMMGFIIFVRSQSDETYKNLSNEVLKGQAAKAIALALVDKEECLKAGSQYFSEEEQNEWYVPYMDFLYDKGIFDPNVILPTRMSVESYLTVGQLQNVLKRLNLIEVSNQLLQADPLDKVSEAIWWKVYDKILESYDRDHKVNEINIKLCGTPSNIPGTLPWQAYTSNGIMGFDGLAMDYYIDSEIKVLQRNGEIIRILDLVERNIVYENAWITGATNDSIEIYVYGVTRSFPVKELPSDCVETLADVKLKGGTVKAIRLKTDRISGKVLAVHDDSIEIEGYGTVPMDSAFQIYNLVDGISWQKKDDILVGYTLQQFIVAGGKICGALTVEGFDAKPEVAKIRVVIMTTGYGSYYHDSVTFSSEGAFTITVGEKTTAHSGGEVITFDRNSEEFASGRILVQPSADTGVSLQSVNRAQGAPTYDGTMELSLDESGIIIVNELPIEDYLIKVVPSEMPARYGVEAARTQAVCARSYAYRQIQANACKAYGAHVDDSTNYQVYNNIGPQEASTQGVKDTYGQVMTLNGQVISTYYFSTSCGYTADNSAWGSNPNNSPYLVSQPVSTTGEILDLVGEDTFRQFIKTTDYPGYEIPYTWYRWNYSISLSELTSVIHTRLEQIMTENHDTVLSEDELGNLRIAEEPWIGELQSIEVVERGAGGIVQEVLIRGTAQTLRIRYATSIRKLFGSPDRMYNNFSDEGRSISEGALLPSAFFCLEEIYDGESLSGYTFFGGGNGHGIGMPQNGVDAMVQAGKSYKEILQYFYKGAKVTNIY